MPGLELPGQTSGMLKDAVHTWPTPDRAAHTAPVPHQGQLQVGGPVTRTLLRHQGTTAADC